MRESHIRLVIAMTIAVSVVSFAISSILGEMGSTEQIWTKEGHRAFEFLKLATIRAAEKKRKPTRQKGTPSIHTAEKQQEVQQTSKSQEQTPLQETKKHKPLNIVLLYPDDMRHDSIGVAGSVVQTPFIDQMAQKGIRFTHNCVTTSICWISRATLFTGQYVSRHKSPLLKGPNFYQLWNQTWPGILREHGYHLGHVGKWQYRDHLMDFKLRDQYDYIVLEEGRHNVVYNHTNIHVTQHNAIYSVEFLRKRPKNRNFALTVAFYAPKAIGRGEQQWFPQASSMNLYNNITIRYPNKMEEMFQKLPYFFHRGNGTELRIRWRERFLSPERYDASMKNYFRMITEIDTANREIVSELERQGILNETMVIFTTDNGFFHAEHGLAGKWIPFQESIRVPLIIHDPRTADSLKGTTMNEYTLNIDLAPTILGAAGLPIPGSMQGRDIADLYLRHSDDWRDEFFYELPSLGLRTWIPECTALVRRDFKYVTYPQWKKKECKREVEICPLPSSQVVSHPEVEQLFNIRDDPLEENDLISDPKYAFLLDEMRNRHDELRAQVKQESSNKF